MCQKICKVNNFTSLCKLLELYLIALTSCVWQNIKCQISFDLTSALKICLNILKYSWQHWNRNLINSTAYHIFAQSPSKATLSMVSPNTQNNSFASYPSYSPCSTDSGPKYMSDHYWCQIKWWSKCRSLLKTDPVKSYSQNKQKNCEKTLF